MKKCYKQSIFQARIQNALDVDMPPYTCNIVNQDEMTRVMGKVGWNVSETKGVVGFHIDDQVYILKGEDWTTLHELIHRAGINSDRINMCLAEGLTELIASELKISADEYQPTYPSEQRWVKEILKRLQMTPIELGKIIVHSASPPITIADLFIAKGITRKPRHNVIAFLQPQVSNVSNMNRKNNPYSVTYKHKSTSSIDLAQLFGVFIFSYGLAKCIKNQ